MSPMRGSSVLRAALCWVVAGSAVVACGGDDAPATGPLDAGGAADGALDARSRDAASPADAGGEPDAGPVADAGGELDATPPPPPPPDAGRMLDAAAPPPDVGPELDAAPAPDASPSADAGPEPDAAPVLDAAPLDAGSAPETGPGPMRDASILDAARPDAAPGDARVDARPSSCALSAGGCCYEDSDCPSGQRCYVEDGEPSCTSGGEGRCEPTPAPLPGGARSCWGDRDCVGIGSGSCAGEHICPCFVDCSPFPDRPGTCFVIP